MSKSTWDANQIPDQSGKTIIITGATSGLGKEATRVLAGKNARILMAVRNTKKAAAVIDEIKSSYGQAKIEVKQLDLGSLKSVKAFAKEINAAYDRLDILINNAGVMACPFSKTEDGFEMQMGVNHLGHFALTGLLMPLLKKTQASRVVVTSSIAHRSGDIDFEDLNWEKRSYNTNKAYGDSKLANLYFAYELERKLKNDPHAPMVVSSHPGWTKTELDRHSGFIGFIGNIIGQKVNMGTLPTLRAAIDDQAKSGDYYGPARLFEMRGYPVAVQSNEMSHNQANAKRLWEQSEALTGIQY